MTAETMKWRRRITTRWRKMTDIAFSSTVKASELKNTMVASSTQPITAAMVQKALQLRNHGRGLPRDQPLEIAPQCGEQLALVDDLRQRDQHEDQQRNDRQQCVIGHGACQQQPLIGAKRAQDPHGECSRLRHHVPRLLVRMSASAPAHVGPAARRRTKQRPGRLTPAAVPDSLRRPLARAARAASHRSQDLPYRTFALPMHVSLAAPASASHFSIATL